MLDPFPMWWLWSSFFIEFFHFLLQKEKKYVLWEDILGQLGEEQGAALQKIISPS